MLRIGALLTVLLVVFIACSEDVAPPVDSTTTSTPPTTSSPTTSAESTTSSTIQVTTTSPPDVELPFDAECALDGAPASGEATVLVDGRLYGLGEDGMSPRCLLEDVTSTDIEWGPVGDRVRIGDEIVTDSARVELFGVASLEWTAPTGSRIVGVSPGRLWKLDLQDATEIDITFLEETEQISYHPAGLHLLAVGTSFDGQYGMWLATNQGTEPSLLAFDESATLSDPAWTWLGEPLFVANHSNEDWHIHRVELTSDGALEGPVLVESEIPIDMLKPSSHDPVMVAYRVGGQEGELCVEGAHVAVRSVDLPEPLSMITSAPVGWLSTERLLVLAYPDGCDSPADLWTFSAGLCPGSVYGASMIISGVDGAAARQPDPPPPPPPDFTGIIDPAPA